MTPTEPSSPPGVVSEGGDLEEKIDTADGLLAGFDFDGTLAPIRADPETPALSPQLAELLKRLASQRNVRVVVISGRALADLTTRIPVPGVDLAGNHGLELRFDGERRVPERVEQRLPDVREALESLRVDLDGVPGIRIEDKQLSLTVHVRETPPNHVDGVRETVKRIVADSPGLTLSEGKQVFEVKPAVSLDKGTAMQRFEQQTPTEWLSLYLGDDTTDEDAFRAIQPDGIGVHVGKRSDTAAGYRILEQSDVPDFLSWLTTRASISEEPGTS